MDNFNVKLNRDIFFGA